MFRPVLHRGTDAAGWPAAAGQERDAKATDGLSIASPNGLLPVLWDKGFAVSPTVDTVDCLHALPRDLIRVIDHDYL